MAKIDNNIKVLVDFGLIFNISGLGSIKKTQIETVFEEDDFLAYAAAAAKE